ncbi:MAG: RNHCP domain-containing protein [Trueperaceae bacterium]
MRRFTAQGTNTAFRCLHCDADVPPLDNGSYRNHCPYCLYSLHVDINPGDRANDCKGVLEPVGVEHSSKKGWIILHRCQACGELRRNKAALDDSVSDDYELIVALSKGTEQL